MSKYSVLLLAPLLLMAGCALSSRQSLVDINPVRTYRASISDLFEAVKSYSLREDFHLDRFGEEAGRVIGHKNTSSSSMRSREFSLATTAMMIIMNLKFSRVSEVETEITATFVFETGHGIVTREEEIMLLECYSSFFEFLDDRFRQSKEVSPS